MENMEKVVYLDNAATTPCAPEALELMVSPERCLRQPQQPLQCGL